MRCRLYFLRRVPVMLVYLGAFLLGKIPDEQEFAEMLWDERELWL